MDDISQEIIFRAARGDIAAFEIIYRKYTRFVFNVALRTTRHKEDAEEIVQEVFLKLYSQLKTFRFESALKTWIYRVTVNMAINYAKKEQKMARDSQEYIDDPTSPSLAAVEPEVTDPESKIEKALSYLTPEQRSCVVLKNIQGLKYQEIAQCLNIDINSVRSRLKRAREKLLEIKKEVMSHELR